MRPLDTAYGSSIISSTRAVCANLGGWTWPRDEQLDTEDLLAGRAQLQRLDRRRPRVGARAGGVHGTGRNLLLKAGQFDAQDNRLS